MPKLPKLPPIKRTGEEHFRFGARKLRFRVLDFWRWANSDLLGNAARGVLAEFLVGQSLGLTAGAGTRVEWDAYDLATPDGRKIEVKSAAYLQTWEQKDFSPVRFDIAPKQWWDAATNHYSPTPERYADVYVFCLLAERDQTKVDPLDLEQWLFWVVSKATLNDRLKGQRTMGLTTLKRLAGPPINYESLGQRIKETL